jgi:hypothetical protein
MLKLDANKDEIENAGIKLVGDDLGATALTPERKAVKAFKGGVWSWIIIHGNSGVLSDSI